MPKFVSISTALAVLTQQGPNGELQQALFNRTVAIDEDGNAHEFNAMPDRPGYWQKLPDIGQNLPVTAPLLKLVQ